MLTDQRRREFANVRNHVSAWAGSRREIVAAGIVGSWARDEARMDSDVDIVVLTTDLEPFLDDESWIAHATPGQAELVRTEDWGALVERRVRLASGFEIEFGFAAPSWAATLPIDSGTFRVVSDGCLPVHDPRGLFASLIAAVNGG